jgi:uncharacterized Zn-binding protein involved in type VI secretion
MKHYTIAVEGDLCDCPLEGHGKTKIVIEQEERIVAIIGDKAECGCAIIEGSTKVIFDNKGVAYQGAKLSSGGCIIGASSPHLVVL